jgi:DNA-binding response OmpR family regulator/DNA-binding CsgD family transcriptional regulator
MTPTPAAEPPRLVVQVVDDAPDTLGFLVDALEAAGYGVLVARSGEAALQSLEWVIPDAILLDALMPGLDGFETCRRIKALPERAHVPVIFMTALSETPHIVAGFEAGGVDYVVKPVKIDEVLARLATHVRNARVSRLAREAVDVGGLGVLLLDAQHRIAWRSPRAGDWLQQFLDLPPERLHWIGESGPGEAMTSLQVRPVADTRLREADLTRREIEVLSWLAKGKTNRDIGDILGLSPRTVNKHLEHVYAKLGVETRASAAALMTREGSLPPP